MQWEYNKQLVEAAKTNAGKGGSAWSAEKGKKEGVIYATLHTRIRWVVRLEYLLTYMWIKIGYIFNGRPNSDWPPYQFLVPDCTIFADQPKSDFLTRILK